MSYNHKQIVIGYVSIASDSHSRDHDWQATRASVMAATSDCCSYRLLGARHIVLFDITVVMVSHRYAVIKVGAETRGIERESSS